jgi:hypothetical protein
MSQAGSAPDESLTLHSNRSCVYAAHVPLQESPFAGGLLLFLYSCGYVAPLLVAATATVGLLVHVSSTSTG